MTIDGFLSFLALVLVVSPVVIVVAYLAVRAGAFAYFRTKREHLKQVLKDLEDGE